MATIVKRVIGALLALVGLALTVVGVWFATQLGSSGTAEFTLNPSTGDPVLIGPDVLNRVDADVVVTATPTPGGAVWMALANPSDATAVVGGAKHLSVTGVSVRDWSLLAESSGTGAAPALGAADLWRQQDDAKGPVTLTVRQSGAPETVVVAAQGGQLSSLRMTVTDKTWFVEAVVAALVGLFLLVVGVVLLTSRRHRHPAPHAVPAVPPVAGGTSAPTDAVEPPGPAERGPAIPGPAERGPAERGPAEHGPAEPTVVGSPSADPHAPQNPEEVTR